MRPAMPDSRYCGAFVRLNCGRFLRIAFRGKAANSLSPMAHVCGVSQCRGVGIERVAGLAEQFSIEASKGICNVYGIDVQKIGLCSAGSLPDSVFQLTKFQTWAIMDLEIKTTQKLLVSIGTTCSRAKSFLCIAVLRCDALFC